MGNCGCNYAPKCKNCIFYVIFSHGQTARTVDEKREFAQLSGAVLVSLLNFIHFDIITALRVGLGLRAINRPVKYVSNAIENI